jgi:SM-20-related protein
MPATPVILPPPMIDFGAIAATPIEREPFQWALVDRALDPARAAGLIDTFPLDDFWRLSHDDGEKSYTYAARPLVILGHDRPANLSPLPDPWQELMGDLLSPEYRAALSGYLGEAMDDAPMEAAVWRWDRSAELGPHLDMADKIVTQVFYLNAGWNPWWGGCLRILRSQDENDLAAELPPILGTSSILVRSERSWHSVSPVASPPVPRRSVIVTWFRPGCTSPSWYEDENGAVQSHARPPGGVREEVPATSGMAALEAHVAEADARCAELSAVGNRRAVRATLRATGLMESVSERVRRRLPTGAR